MDLDWDILKAATVLNLLLAAFWKLREITVNQIMAQVDARISALELRLVERFERKKT